MSGAPRDEPFEPRGAFRLVPRRAADLPGLADLWVASWRAAMPQIDFAARRNWFAAHVQAMEDDGGVTFCAFDAQARPAGFCLLAAARNHLDQIAAHPRHFGSGLADLLMNAAKAHCPDGLTLDVNADNPRALRFYARHGFVRAAAGTNPNSGLPIFTLRRP